MPNVGARAGTETAYFVHGLADVQTSTIGAASRIWQFVIILPGARIGSDCNICSHCFIENHVLIGDRVTIKSGVQLWDGIVVEDDVFIGPNASFCNDRFPRSRQPRDSVAPIRIGEGASIGAGAVILPGISIGRGAMIGAGAVVTRSVPDNAIVTGNPGRITGYVDARALPGGDAPVNLAPADLSAVSRIPGVELKTLPRISDPRGSLSVGEFQRSISFEARRYFVVFGVPGHETRGAHAHRECHQFLVCVSGSVRVLADNGRDRQEFLLDRPELGLHLSPMIWGIQYRYSADAVLLVFASHHYDSADYVRDYQQFLSLTAERA